MADNSPKMRSTKLTCKMPINPQLIAPIIANAPTILQSRQACFNMLGLPICWKNAVLPATAY